tara:strand:+ start:575 stop:1939 length:1365 start_codon:yes stop_codon:yes gene_type:complete
MPRKSKHSYLKLHHNTWHFRYRLPADVRHSFDGKHEIIKSLKTDDIREAERRKHQHLDLVVNRIKAIRTGDDTSLHKAALYWRSLMNESDEARGEFANEALDEAVNTYIDGGWSTVLGVAGRNPDQIDAIKRSPKGDRVLEFMDIALGKNIPSGTYIKDWEKAYDVKAKTRDLAVSEVKRFVKEFPYLNMITKKAVTQWIEKKRDDGAAVSTIRRCLTHIGQYWHYLQRLEEVPGEYNPFSGHSLKKRNGGQTDVVGFTPDEVTTILDAVYKKEDTNLKHLIIIALYTGMRIEEICSMKISNISKDRFKITGTKTKAGSREIPISQAIIPLVKQLVGNSTDGYLITGLTSGSYGNRSTAIGKRFGRVKSGLDFPSRSHVFHSFRHSFSTALLRTGANSIVIDFLMGHKSDNLAIDTYSDGASFKQKQEAILKINIIENLEDYIETKQVIVNTND